MNDLHPIKLFFTMFAYYVPMLITCLVAGVVILLRWRQAGSGSIWALLGFGLALMLCFAMPIGQTLLQCWVFQSGAQAGRMWAFTAFSMIGSLLHAVAYALLLVAIHAGRPKPDAAPPPPFAGP